MTKKTTSLVAGIAAESLDIPAYKNSVAKGE